MLPMLQLFKKWLPFGQKPKSKDDLSEIFRAKYERFKELLDSNAELSKIMADMEDKLRGHDVFGMSYVRSQSARAAFHTLRMIRGLDVLSKQKYPRLFEVLEEINLKIKDSIGQRKESPVTEWILPYSLVNKEMVDWVGGKSANLGEVLTRVKLPIPEGFAITTQAFEYFLSFNELVDEINKQKMVLSPNDPQTVQIVSEEIQRLIISAPVPPDLREAILSAYDAMIQRLEERNSGYSPQVSMRSSAIGEDSELSYAGQYLSMLNVPREKLCQTYNYIIASLYTPRAIAYRFSKGIRDEDIAMSVACLQMVDSVSSGVVYSRHPFNLWEDAVIITAVQGLGPYAVDGVVTPDTYKVAKDEALTIQEIKISHKAVQLVSNPAGGLREIPVPECQQDSACLKPDEIRLLANYAIKLEEHYGCPQDMEWAMDKDGNILVLQTRPLRLETHGQAGKDDSTPIIPGYPLLVDEGAVAYPGIGFGPAFQVHSEDDLSAFPEGGILVAKHSSPKFVIVMQKAQAIITDSGSVTGHMASLCREFRVPTVLDAKGATSKIPTGMEITVDAYCGRVYQGKVAELLNAQMDRESQHMKDTPVYETLKQVAEYITPLHLYDPKAPNFTPDGCESLHDIMRLVHEFSYTEMFQISDMVSDTRGCAVKLEAHIPLDLYVIDLGGGLHAEATHARRITPKHVLSAPFKAVLAGMTHEDLRYHRPRPIELKGFFSVMSEQMLSNTQTAERFGDRSYAIISDKYLNFSSRVGYHYGILDTYCGQTMNKNYITFSFKGGAADDVRRNRRARAIGLIFKELDFTVDIMADRIDARFQKYDKSIIEEKLDYIGRLLLFTRQMDMLMNSESSVETMARCFLDGNYQMES